MDQDEETMTEAECIVHIMERLGCSMGEALSMFRAAIRNGELPALTMDDEGSLIRIDPATVTGVQ